MSGDTCKRSMHSFKPAPGTVKRSDLLGICDECQAETVLEWHNRDKWNRGEIIPPAHTITCSMRGKTNGYLKAL